MRWSLKRRSSGWKTAILASALVFPGVTAAQALTLTEAVELAIQTNPNIGIVAANREAVDEELTQARGLYLPQVDLAAGIGKERTNDVGTRADVDNEDALTLTRQEFSVTLQQRLFDGFEASNTVEREKSRIESAARRVHENSEVLALDVIGAYMEVLRQRELVRLAEENLGVHQQILGSLEQRLRGGAGSSADVAQTNARISRSRATVTQTLQDLRVAEATFTRIIGQFPDSLSAPDFPSGVLPGDLDSAVDMAGKGNLTKKIFDADVRTAEAEVDLSEAPFYPSINIEAESVYNDGRDAIDTYEFNNQVMLRLSWNLFRGGIDRANRQEQLARLRESKNRRLAAFLDAEQEMRTSWFELESARQQVEDYTSAVQFNTETRNSYSQQFEVAQRTLLDVLDAENELFVSRGQLVTAQTNEVLASYRVLAVAGQLLPTLGVSAPEQAVVSIPSWGADLIR